MQFRGVGVVLDGLDKRVDGLVLLFVQQVVQTPEVGAGGLAAFDAPLAKVEPRRQPAQPKRQGKAPEQPGEVKFHGAGCPGGCRWVARDRQLGRPGPVWRFCGPATTKAASPTPPGPPPAPAPPAAPAPIGRTNARQKTD